MRGLPAWLIHLTPSRGSASAPLPGVRRQGRSKEGSPQLILESTNRSACLTLVPDPTLQVSRSGKRLVAAIKHLAKVHRHRSGKGVVILRRPSQIGARPIHSGETHATQVPCRAEKSHATPTGTSVRPDFLLEARSRVTGEMKTLVVEALGFDRADYTSAKTITHSRMKTLGQLVTVDPSEVEQDVAVRKNLRTLDIRRIWPKSALLQSSSQSQALPMWTANRASASADYLMRAFPTRQMQTFTDDTGAAQSLPMSDVFGNPIHNPEAIEARAQLLEHICALPPVKSALDALIEHFGTDMVAEETDRSRCLEPTSDGHQKIETRSGRFSQVEAAALMAGTKRVLMFSDPGGTGRSYYASLDVRNQQQRAHFLLEKG